jgi:hypothetical protein
MRTFLRLALACAALIVVVAPVADAATVKKGSPRVKHFRGKALAIVFFHPT